MTSLLGWWRTRWCGLRGHDAALVIKPPKLKFTGYDASKFPAAAKRRLQADRLRQEGANLVAGQERRIHLVEKVEKRR